MAEKVDLEATVTAVRSKTDTAVTLLEEKLCREYSLTLDELRQATVTIKGGEVTVKTKGK
jgi:hypothetical protein